MKFINLHTHIPTGTEQTIEVENLYSQRIDSIPEHGIFSTGIHPWHINEVAKDIDARLDRLEMQMQTSRVLMLGECGLDRVADTTMDQQMPVFIEQLKLAEKYRKPVLLHCVRAYTDIISVRKKQKISVPFIFHSYHGNFQITDLLLKHDVYFSFGQHLINNPILQKILEDIPKKRIFFETDNVKLPIERMYATGEKTLQMESAVLRSKINDNFVELFY